MMSRSNFMPLAVFVGLVVAGATAKPAASRCLGATCKTALLYIGTHTGGPGQGLFAARMDEATGHLTGLGSVAEIERPTWQEIDPRHPILYSVSETGNDGKSQGAAYSLAIDPVTGKVATISRTPSGGGGATYLTHDAPSRTLFVANFGGGQVSAIPVGPDGALEPVASIQTDYGSGPNRRQAGPHPHGVTVDPSGRFVLAPDLGADRIFVYRFDAATRRLWPSETPFAPLPPGSGPRHLVFSRDGRFAFLDTELSGRVYSFRWNQTAGRLDPAFDVAIDPPDFQGQRSAAEIAVSPDGRFLYVSSRGADTIVVFAINPQTGALNEVQRLSCGGQTPWSFRFDPTGRWFVVANEASSTLTVFTVGRVSGQLTPTTNTLEVPKPVSLAFWRP